MFLLSGLWKALVPIALPGRVDPTVATGLLTAAAAVKRLHGHGWHVPRPLWGILAFLALAAVPILWTAWTPYATMKVARFYTLTAIAVLAAPIIVRTRISARRLLLSIAMSGLVVGVIVYFTGNIFHLRWDVEGASSVAVGRSLGVTVCLLIVTVVAGRGAWRWVLLIPAGALVLLIAAVGNRQGLLGAAVAFGVVIFARPNVRGIRALLVTLAIGVTAWVMLSADLGELIPRGSSERLAAAIALKGDTSTHIRGVMMVTALKESGMVGYGWGAFESMGFISRGFVMTYPHNVVVEAAYELGFFVAFILLFLMLRAAARAAGLYRRSLDPVDACLLAFCIFYLVVACVSGDLYSNREFFAAVGIALCLSHNSFGLAATSHNVHY